MEVTGDELAGVVDLFGALTPTELRQAVAELAFKRGVESPDVDSEVDSAIDDYRLVAIEPDDDPAEPGEREGNERLLVAGPTAFPTHPAGAADLPHILAIDTRKVDRERLTESVERRFRADAARAVAAGNEAEIEALLDVSYDLDAWGAVDLDDVRTRLDAASARTD